MTIEVISAGGDFIDGRGAESGSAGYLTSRIVLEYDAITALDDEPNKRYKPVVGDRDES